MSTPLHGDAHRGADVDPTARLGAGSVVWPDAQLREHVHLGDEASVGRGAYLGPGVVVGARSKIQNAALLYEPARLGAGVFVGPGVVLTNDRAPRAVTPEGRRKLPTDWMPTGVVVDDGASLGAGSTCVAPVAIGAWALVAAGAVVVDDVAPHALVAGVPARQIGWVGRAGHRLVAEGDDLVCPVTGDRHREVDGQLVAVAR